MTHRATDARPETARSEQSVAPSTSLVRSVRGAVIGLYLSYVEYQSRRALRTLLRSLHDRTLKDLGIERDEIDVVANSTVARFHRPSVEGKEVAPKHIAARLASQEANAMAGSSLWR